MCEYCEHGKLIFGGDGYFYIGTRTLRRRDGETQEQPILKYEASDDVFSTEIQIDDHFVINNCPMCGRELGGDAE
jgi:hypothetical protein